MKLDIADRREHLQSEKTESERNNKWMNNAKITNVLAFHSEKPC